VFRHDDISHHHESIALTSLFQNREEAVAAARSAQKRQSLIAGAGDKVQVMGAVGPMQAAWHDGSANNTLTWNPNGTLKKLVIADTLNTADAQTCNYAYDDLSRLLTDNCGSVWNQSFSYDPFGNVTKSGSAPWPSSGGYNSSNNRYSSSAFTYDANGRLTNDTFDSPIAWDIEGNMVTQSSTSFAYDGLGRTAGSAVGGVWTNYIYAPGGGLVATANNSGTIQKMFVPLPMATAVYSGGSLQQYRRNDWEGSVRVASTPSQGPFSDVAYASFGEPYSPQGTTNNQYAGLTSDISSGTEQVSLSRRYHPTQGRWLSPDPAGIASMDLTNPQTLNRYAYVMNNPTGNIDPLGLFCPVGHCDSGGGGDGVGGGGGGGGGGDPCFFYPELCGGGPPPPITPPPGGGGGGGGGGNKPANNRTVHPLYDGIFSCNANAQGLMQQVEGNFSQFANYQGSFSALGVPVSASASFFPSTVVQGGTINIQNVNSLGNHSPGQPAFFTQVNGVSVTVSSVSPTSFTFDTNPGHVLYPASITFSAADAGSSQVNFSIQVNGDFANFLTGILYNDFGGQQLENNIWNNFLNNVQKSCGSSN